MHDSVQNNTKNASCWNDYCENEKAFYSRLLKHVSPTIFEWVMIVFYAFLFIVGLTGNALVIWAVCNNKHMRSVTNLFITNLAIADLLVLLFCLPITCLGDVTETWYLGTVMCKITIFLQVMSFFVTNPL